MTGDERWLVQPDEVDAQMGTAEANAKWTRSRPSNRHWSMRGLHTLEETAEHFGVTRQSIEATEKRAFAKIRKALGNAGVKSAEEFING